MSTGDGFHEQRDHLVALLYEAAELEHSACCMYLSAAFSMCTDPLEGGCTYEQIDQIRIWKSTMLSIARMEMEHLAIVNNVLTAIGEPNWFQRPAFPMSKRFFPVDLPLALLPFTLETLGTFLLLEFPDEPTPQERDLVAYLKTSPLPADQHLLQRIGNARGRESHSLVELYDAIIDLVTRLGAEKPERLFIGLAAAQVAGTTLFPEFPPVGPGVRIYDVLLTTVTDTASALTALEQVRQEGEGSVSKRLPVGGHFLRFLEMYRELSAATQRDPSFVPSRPVVPNPVTTDAPGSTSDPSAGGTVVTHPASVEMMLVYDLAYDICLRLLARLFTETPGTNGYEALQDATFFPMMTLVMRPIGDVLTLMPAFDSGPERAGPAFRVPSSVNLVPHNEVAWTVISGQLDELRDRAAALAARPDLPARALERVTFFAQNTWRLAQNFRDKVGLKENS